MQEIKTQRLQHRLIKNLEKK